MCKHTISRYTLCAHTLSTSARCPDYTPSIFQTRCCTTEASESTRFSRCPKCCAARPTVDSKEVRIRWVSAEEETLFETCHSHSRRRLNRSRPVKVITPGRRVRASGSLLGKGKHGESGKEKMGLENGIGDRIGAGTKPATQKFGAATTADYEMAHNRRAVVSSGTGANSESDNLAAAYRRIIGEPALSLAGDWRGGGGIGY